MTSRCRPSTSAARILPATVEFVDGAQLQAKQLGADPAAVYVAHPIQDRTDAEMEAIADAALAQVIEALVWAR